MSAGRSTSAAKSGAGQIALDPWLEPVPVEYVARLISRNRSLFEDDFAPSREAISASLADAQVVVVGAAGSIGAAFVKELTRLRPGSLVLVDISENGLADLMRDLRGAPIPAPSRLASSVVAFGSPGFARFYQSLGQVDFVFNFSALKHVRSERDPYGLMRMIETNAFALDDFVNGGLLAKDSRLFSVSSDKAVFPSNLMGATKRWMEKIVAGAPVPGTSARFANVAFSAGSLPEAFLRWLSRGQPLAGPTDVRRYFISHQEAAQLCLLSGFTGKHGQVFAPRLTEDDAVSMVDAATRVLDVRGMTPEHCDSEETAKASPYLTEQSPKRWPVVFSGSDTSGEKDLEELWYDDEARDDGRFRNIAVMTQTKVDVAALKTARAMVEDLACKPTWSKKALVEAIHMAVPELRHKEAGRSLDEKL